MAGRILKTSLLLMLAFSATAEAEEGRLRLATTTSLYDTGLLDVMEDTFEQEYDMTMDTVSGGTGIALEYAERGDVDVVIVHDLARERAFIEDGYGTERRCIAYNYFYIVGPEDDPAGIAGMDASEALATIREMGMENPEEIKFISRGDNSGTHAREKLLWQNADLDYSEINESEEGWYLEAGSGMGSTLMMADELGAYTLSDMSTFMAYQGDLTLVPLIEGGDELLNVYAAIPVNPENHEGINCAAAAAFVDFLVSDGGQEIIRSYGEETYGEPLFFQAAGSCDVMDCSDEECANPLSISCGGKGGRGGRWTR